MRLSPTPEQLSLLQSALDRLREGFASLPDAPEHSADHAPDHTRPEAVAPALPMQAVLQETATRLHDNFPYHHPLYAGQMLKPPHPVAQLAYALATSVNPNNHALDGGRASSALEKEAVAQLAAMFGWREHLGHLTGGGTMANLEALWIAGQLAPGATVLASSQAHYTHARISAVLGLPFESVPCDTRGRMDLRALEARLAKGGVGAVVATMGTTATGAVDPLGAILDLRAKHGFRVHADAAYGGYHVLAGNLARETSAAFARIGEADSIVVDPHKHGLQPYGCGCVLHRDPSVGRFYRHDSPYTYFSSAELHLGEISLECSRPGAAAVALWATQRLLPLERGGEFVRGLEASREAALELHAKLAADPRFMVGMTPELDIVVWGVRATSVSASSAAARRVFEEAAKLGLHLALAELPIAFFGGPIAAMHADQPTLTALRSVLMKPEHREWLVEILARLDAAADAARG
ncbi:MAG: aspartate aminotransferase family protein [Candidatus Eisenbacteria bacterium]|uniref:Aspartate aminotransferase family protein n=1 Tax=Eiseniibacteriota bacterium TaxID=2212470 RepID=A0A933S908_UNCEI|nr:aspartate aminotransferase family protein [Candidatus Eisenbacteria bacterium]